MSDVFKERCEQLEALGEEIDEDQVFYEDVGGHDHKRILYGFGTDDEAIASNKGSTETSYMPDNNVDKERAKTKAEIEQLKGVNEDAKGRKQREM